MSFPLKCPFLGDFHGFSMDFPFPMVDSRLTWSPAVVPKLAGRYPPFLDLFRVPCPICMHVYIYIYVSVSTCVFSNLYCIYIICNFVHTMRITCWHHLNDGCKYHFREHIIIGPPTKESRNMDYLGEIMKWAAGQIRLGFRITAFASPESSWVRCAMYELQTQSFLWRALSREIKADQIQSSRCWNFYQCVTSRKTRSISPWCGIQNSNELIIVRCVQTQEVTESHCLLHFRFFFKDSGSEAAV